MAELKTKESGASVTAFLESIEHPQRRADAVTVLELMKRVTKADPKMWGTAIVGFGSHHYKYASGREGDWFNVGFSPRKDALTLYLTGGIETQADLLAKLGKYKTGKGCLYVKRLEDVDLGVLQEMIARSAKGALPHEA